MFVKKLLCMNQVSDETMIVYMSEKAKEMKTNTLYDRCSVLKSCVKIKQNTDISNYLETRISWKTINRRKNVYLFFFTLS